MRGLTKLINYQKYVNDGTVRKKEVLRLIKECKIDHEFLKKLLAILK